MENINFQKSNWDELLDLTTAYFTELGYKNDSFFYSNIFDNESYKIILDDVPCGFFSMGISWDKLRMLYAFYITPDKRGISDKILDDILEKMDIQAAFVVSNDQHFVSLAFEKMNALGTGFEMQAYNFVYGKPSREAEYSMEHLFEVQPDEYETMNSLTEGQWDGCFGDPDFSFYAIRHEGKTLGYGAYGKMKYNDKYVDVGNFTLPEHRQKGVGRSLIINISKLVIKQGLIPAAGCWYGNKNSIMTLKSSGFIPENRLFKVKFR